MLPPLSGLTVQLLFTIRWARFPRQCATGHDARQPRRGLAQQKDHQVTEPYKAFAARITQIAEEDNVDAPTMIGACMTLLRGLYACLPALYKQDYCHQLHRFANELEATNPTALV